MTHEEMLQVMEVEQRARAAGRLEGLAEGRRKGLQEARERILAIRSAQHRDTPAWSLLRTLEAELEALCP
jgi:hypothetical protein